MLAQICQFLAVDSSNFPQNEHIIIGDRSREGGFLIHYFLNLCQKQNRPVCFVSFSQSFNHYNTVAQKLGTNLLSARDQNKNLIFIEALKILESCILPVNNSKRHSNYEQFEQLLKGNVLPFVSLIGELIQNLNSNSERSPVVIIDDLSLLLNVGIKTNQLHKLIFSLHHLLNNDKVNGSLITFTHINEGDDESEQLWTSTCHLGSLRIEVSDLKTGYCKEVHGQMEVHWQSSIHHPRKVTSKESQFRLTEKSIEFFAAGLSTAVL